MSPHPPIQRLMKLHESRLKRLVRFSKCFILLNKSQQLSLNFSLQNQANMFHFSHHTGIFNVNFLPPSNNTGRKQVKKKRHEFHATFLHLK